MTLRNQHVEDRRPFFLRSNQNSEKTVAFFLEDLFFGNHIKILKKRWHFSRLFWSSRNRRMRRSIIFELVPGPRYALGAPGCQDWLGVNSDADETLP